MGIFRFLVCLFLLLLSTLSQADITSNTGDNGQAASEIITMTGAAYAGDVWVLDINYPISKTITYVAGSIATGKNILNAAIGFAAQINADSDASQILTAIAVDSTEGYAAEVHLEMIEGLDGFDASVSVTGNNGRELSVSITNNLNLDETDNDGQLDFPQTTSEIITMTGAAYAGDVWVLDINHPISKTITYVAGSIANGKNILNAAIGFAAQINADPDASQILTAIAVDSTEGYAAEVHLEMIEGVDGFDASVSVTGNNGRELSVSITNNLILNDTDSDEDGILNSFDVFPYDSTEWLDTDLDGIGNNTDVDDDNDGILDIVDIWPEDTRYSIDTDMDGMPDSYEELYQFNIYDASDATYDPDEDGMGAFSEFLLNTSPRYWDSDGDGQPDASDDANDYVIDLSSDTDNDGLVNSEEILLRTSYKNSDTDSDGMPDGWEIENNRNPIIADYQVSSGNDHTCALDDTGVVCWGNNHQGQIDVPQLLNPTQISAGFNHNCAIDDTGVVCWGSNSHGQTNVPNLISPKFVKSNRYYSCAVDAYEVKCWGHINGLPENVSTSEEIILGHSFVCGINKGELICSGSNSDGQLNLPNERYVSDASLGNNHGCAVFDGDVKCWGRNHFGMAEPTVLNNPTVISVNRVHSCAVDSAGVKCWGRGDNFSGMPELNGVLQLSAGDEHTCAIDSSGVHCWGHNDAGERDVPELIFDFDRDGYKNNHDTFPLDSAEQQDTDNDGIGNNADTDDDGDGIADENDAFPTNSLYYADSDNDGMADEWEVLYGLNPNDPSDTASDQDDDGVLALQEFLEGTVPVIDSDNDGFADHIDLFPQDPTESTDTDEDGIGDNQDNCPLVDNALQLDMDQDGTGNACDEDIYDNEVFRYKVLGDGAQIVGCSGTCPSDLIIPDSIDGHVVTSIGAEAFRGAGIASLDLPDSIVGIKYAAFMVNALTNVEIPSSVAEIGHEAFSSNQLTSLSIPGNVAWIYSGAFKHNQLINLDLHDGIRFIGNTAFWDNNLTLTNVPQSVVQIQESAFADNNLASVIFEGNRPEIYENSFAGNQLIHIYYCSDEDWSNDSVQNLIPERYDGCDRDNDGYIDSIDVFPQNPSEWLDTDQDGVGDNEDTDADNDGFLNTQDTFPLIASEQYDFDLDGIGDNADSDDDNDNVLDSIDLFPLDAFESTDTDGDGVGDNADFFPNSAEYSLDSDLDQMPDAWERKYGLNPTDASDALLDQDNDGLTALEEYEAGTIPLKILDIDANGSFDALTDGLIILRYAFGLRGENLVRSATAGDAMRTDAADVEAYLNSLVPGL